MRFDTLFRTILGVVLILYAVGMPFAVEGDEWLFIGPGVLGAVLLVYNWLKGGFRDYYWVYDPESKRLQGPMKNDAEFRRFLETATGSASSTAYWIPARTAQKAAKVLRLNYDELTVTETVFS